MNRWGRLLVMLTFLFPAACAPTLKPPGPATIEPRLEAEAIVTADEARLPYRRWLPADGQPVKAVIVALHGMNDYSNAFDGPGKYLAARGVAVYAYDQRGFGQGPWPSYWAGEEAMTNDLSTALRLIGGRHPGVPLYAMGESMGGAVVMRTMTSAHPPAVSGVILSAPAVWGRDDMNIFERSALWMTSHVLPWMTLTGEGLNVAPSDNIEMLRALSRDPLVIKETRVDTIHGLVDLMTNAQNCADRLATPALVLYGEHDEVIPAAPSYRMMSRLAGGDSQVKAVYANGYHMLLRDLQAQVVLADIAAWIDAPHAPLPSGADRRAENNLTSIRFNP
ncbi:MAG TPA: lysophospholipase [Candidatus Sulfotelmatobacter sp.]|jgi:alpha-beta hydrolase superfamily lysophospholipase|nr:lysophospholipase [Candidatus Sulfotelmatobacter sp.]